MNWERRCGFSSTYSRICIADSLNLVSASDSQIKTYIAPISMQCFLKNVFRISCWVCWLILKMQLYSGT